MGGELAEDFPWCCEDGADDCPWCMDDVTEEDEEEGDDD